MTKNEKRINALNLEQRKMQKELKDMRCDSDDGHR